MAETKRKTVNLGGLKSSKDDESSGTLKERAAISEKIIVLRKRIAALDDEFLIYIYNMFVETLLQPFDEEDKRAILETAERVSNARK